MKKTPDKRQLIIALAIILLSVGALLWQVSDFQKRHAKMMAENSESSPDQTLNLQWRTATRQEREPVLASIKNQLEAFKRDDYEAALKYQSHALRFHFPDAKEFRHMIQSGYPQFAHYKKVGFGSEQIDKNRKFFKVPVTVTGKDGIMVGAVYNMIYENGVWRISGVEGGNPPPGYRFKKPPSRAKLPLVQK